MATQYVSFPIFAARVAKVAKQRVLSLLVGAAVLIYGNSAFSQIIPSDNNNRAPNILRDERLGWGAGETVIDDMLILSYPYEASGPFELRRACADRKTRLNIGLKIAPDAPIAIKNQTEEIIFRQAWKKQLQASTNQEMWAIELSESEVSSLVQIINAGNVYIVGPRVLFKMPPLKREVALALDKIWLRGNEAPQAKMQFCLGGMYRGGYGVRKDYQQAAYWYQKAAEQGHVVAQSNLGSMYERGEGVPQDYILAHMWFSLAATNGDDALIRRNAASSSARVAAKMTPQQLAEAERLAREWKPKPEQALDVNTARQEEPAKPTLGAFPLASCKGWGGQIVSKSGIDTANAQMRGIVTEADIKEYCVRQSNDTSKCLDEFRWATQTTLQTAANCSSGQVRAEISSPKYNNQSVIQFPLTDETDTSCASRLPPVIKQFAILCPSAASELDIQGKRKRNAGIAPQNPLSAPATKPFASGAAPGGKGAEELAAVADIVPGTWLLSIKQNDDGNPPGKRACRYDKDEGMAVGSGERRGFAYLWREIGNMTRTDKGYSSRGTSFFETKESSQSPVVRQNYPIDAFNIGEKDGKIRIVYVTPTVNVLGEINVKSPNEFSIGPIHCIPRVDGARMLCESMGNKIEEWVRCR
jgi:hypothetical protein